MSKLFALLIALNDYVKVSILKHLAFIRLHLYERVARKVRAYLPGGKKLHVQRERHLFTLTGATLLITVNRGN